MRDGRVRTLAGLFLAAIGALTLLAGTLLLWASDDLFDRDRFVGHAVTGLESPQVHEALAARLTDQLIAAEPDLVVARPVIEWTVSGLVGSDQFRVTFGRAVGVAHDELFTVSGVPVRVELREVGTQLAAIADQVGAELPAEVDDLGAVLATYDLRRTESRLLRAAERTRALGAALPPIGVILIVAGVVVAVDRRRAIGLAGACLGAGALLGLAALAVVRWRIEASISDPLLAAAVGDLVDPFARGARRALIVPAAAAMVTLAALADRQPLAVLGDLVTSARERAAALPSGRAVDLVRVAALAAIGLALVAQPGPVTRVLVTAIGALALFEATASLMRLVAGPRPAPDAVPRPPSTRRSAADRSATVRIRAATSGAGWGRFALGGVVVLAAVGFAAVDRSVAQPQSPVVACNGHPQLCDRPFDDVVLLGTHNAGATVADGFIAPYQELSVADQLDAGARALLLDVFYGTPSDRLGGTVVTDLSPDASGADRLFTCHGRCEIGARPFAHTLADIAEFLDANPAEVVVLFVEDYVRADDVATALTDAGLLDRVYDHSPGSDWPTLREMILADTRVIVLAENDGGEPSWYHAGFDLVMDTPFRFPTVESLDTDDACAENRGPDEADLFLLNHWVQPDGPVLPSLGERANESARIIARSERCEALRGARPTIIAIDFLGRGDPLAAVDALNGVGPPAS